MTNASTLFAENCLPPEQALLGGLLLHPERFKDVQLSSEDFFYLEHGWIWSAMQAIDARGDEPTPALVTTELRARQQLDDIGGIGVSPFYGHLYLDDLTAQKEAFEDPAPYGKVVAALAARRQLADYHDAGGKLIFQQHRTIYDILAESKAALSDIEQRIQRQRDGGLQGADVAITQDVMDSDENWQAYQAAVKNRFRLGIPSLDEKVSVMPTEFVLFGARTGTGKSVILGNVVYYNLLAPFLVSDVMSDDLHLPIPGGRYIRYPKPAEIERLPRIAFFSLEMSVDQLLTRWVSMITGIEVKRQNNGTVTREEFSAMQDSKALIKKWLGSRLLMMCDSLTIEQMVAECETYKPDVVITDYIQLFQTSGTYDNDAGRISLVSKSHKSLAMCLNIPIISAAQVNRDGDKGPDRGPRLSELKGSGSLEEDADTVVLMHRPEISDPKKRPGETDFNVAKHRNGETGLVTLGTIKKRTLFTDIAEDKPDKLPPSLKPKGATV